MRRSQLVDSLNGYLHIENFKDYCPNGLQIEGASEINRVLCGVSASQALIERAIEEKAQALLVHHGFFWKNELPVITGIKKNRIAALLSHHINLLAYHLPLDAHEEVGNNVLMGKALGITDQRLFGEGNLARIGQLPTSMSIDDLTRLVTKRLGREPQLIAQDSMKEVSTVAWCTGAAQDFLQQAAEAGAQVYISGEISERTVLESRELDVAYLASGHHATERLGINALGKWLQEQFAEISVSFVDIDNPV